MVASTRPRTASLRTAGQTPPSTDPTDAKIIAYCRANPNASLADAMTNSTEFEK
jgi:hypothetical protein